MSISKMIILARALVIGALASGVAANAPMSGHEHTETALPQEIGTMTSDGLLVYSMNHCVITQTTNCEVSLSTGPPAVETPGEASDVPYPVPTGEPGVPGEPEEPTGGEPGEPVEPTGTDGESTPTDGPSNTGDITATETVPSPTDGETGVTGTATETAATGTATAGAAGIEVFEAGVFGMAGLIAAYLV